MRPERLRSFFRSRAALLVSLFRFLIQAPKNIRFRFLTREIKVPRGRVAVFYLTPRFPAPPEKRTEYARGGAVKLTYLSEQFPHSTSECNILYVVSSVFQNPTVIRMAKEKGLKIVWNQNGVFYPAWYGPGWQKRNSQMAQAMHLADYVIYQSGFCKFSADHFLGEYKGLSSILYNPVDVHHFSPASRKDPSQQLILLTIANRVFYRMESALLTLTHVRKAHPQTKMMIPGMNPKDPEQKSLQETIERLIRRLNLGHSAIFLPPYTQQEAPAIFNRAHILVHTTYNDACPNLVAEAMACGLPVAYSASGGVPELVGDDAGIGVPEKLDWEKIHPPDPQLLAQAILKIASSWVSYSQAARRRAEGFFALDKFVSSHRHVFEKLLDFPNS